MRTVPTEPPVGPYTGAVSPTIMAPCALISVPPLNITKPLTAPLLVNTPELCKLPATASEPLLVSVAPAMFVLLPASAQLAPASMVTCAKSTNCVPSPVNVPAEAPDANSSVLRAVAPIVLPPSTVPMNAAPGSSTNNPVKPVANPTPRPAVPVMPIVPAFTIVPEPLVK